MKQDFRGGKQQELSRIHYRTSSSLIKIGDNEVWKNWIKSHSLELQFWGYEVGNVVAAVAGVGGFFALFSSFNVGLSLYLIADGSPLSEPITVFQSMASVFIKQPDLVVTLGIGIIVLVSAIVRTAISVTRRFTMIESLNYMVVCAATLLLVFALGTDTSLDNSRE